VWSKPTTNSKGFLVLSEAPGEAEVHTGEPLTGPSGSYFNSTLRKASIDRNDLWLSNVLCCRPPANDINHPDARNALGNCIHGLRQELHAAWNAGLRVILAQGDTAVKALESQANSRKSVEVSLRAQP
jgi:uracil-DNA glycosylase family 4